MKIWSVTALIACSLALASCQTASERRAEQDAEDHLTCNEYGAKRGSDAYVRCRTDLQRNRELRYANRSPVFVTGGFYPVGGFCRSTYYGVRCY